MRALLGRSVRPKALRNKREARKISELKHHSGTAVRATDPTAVSVVGACAETQATAPRSGLASEQECGGWMGIHRVQGVPLGVVPTAGHAEVPADPRAHGALERSQIQYQIEMFQGSRHCPNIPGLSVSHC